jgi:hypothetical protein
MIWAFSRVLELRTQLCYNQKKYSIVTSFWKKILADFDKELARNHPMKHSRDIFPILTMLIQIGRRGILIASESQDVITQYTVRISYYATSGHSAC